MTGDKELLEYMKENIDAGLEALVTLDKNLEETDNKIKSNVDKALCCFREFKVKNEALLLSMDSKPKRTNLMTLLMTKMGSKAEFMRDNSDSKIAETLIQGYNMGIIDITKKLNKYKGDVSKEVLKLANDYKDMMKTGIKDIKKFL